MQNPDSECRITNVYLRGNLRDGTGAEPGGRAGGGSGAKPEGLVESGTGRQTGSGAVGLVTGRGPGVEERHN